RATRAVLAPELCPWSLDRKRVRALAEPRRAAADLSQEARDLGATRWSPGARRPRPAERCTSRATRRSRARPSGRRCGHHLRSGYSRHPRTQERARSRALRRALLLSGALARV